MNEWERDCNMPAETAQFVKTIAEHPFLKGMSVSSLQVLADSAMLKDFEAGELIFRAGDLANRFYLIREGEVALQSPEAPGEPRLVQNIGSGDVLGWSWLFPPYYWRFDARATKPTQAIFFYGTRLREQCDSNPALGYDLMNRMASIIIDRLQNTRQQLLECYQRERQLSKEVKSGG